MIDYEFTATGSATYSAFTADFAMATILPNALPTNPVTTDLETELTKHLTALETDATHVYNQLYADYSTASATSKTLSAGTDYSVDLALKPINGRVVVFFTNNSNSDHWEFELSCQVYVNSNGTLIPSTEPEDQFVTTHNDYQYGSVLILNSANTIGGSEVRLAISKRAKGSSDAWESASDIVINVENGVSKSHLIYYSGAPATTSMALTYDNFTFTESVEEI